MKSKSFAWPRAVVFLVTVGAFIFLGGCSGLQTYGNTGVDVTFYDNGQLSGIHWVDGKEKKSVKLFFKAPNGMEFKYEAKDVEAFQGQAIAAAAMVELTKAGVDGAKGIARAIAVRALGLGVLQGAGAVAGAVLAP